MITYLRFIVCLVKYQDFFIWDWGFANFLEFLYLLTHVAEDWRLRLVIQPYLQVTSFLLWSLNYNSTWWFKHPFRFIMRIFVFVLQKAVSQVLLDIFYSAADVFECVFQKDVTCRASVHFLLKKTIYKKAR